MASIKQKGAGQALGFFDNKSEIKKGQEPHWIPALTIILYI